MTPPALWASARRHCPLVPGSSCCVPSSPSCLCTSPNTKNIWRFLRFPQACQCKIWPTWPMALDRTWFSPSTGTWFTGHVDVFSLPVNPHIYQVIPPNPCSCRKKLTLIPRFASLPTFCKKKKLSRPPHPNDSFASPHLDHRHLMQFLLRGRQRVRQLPRLPRLRRRFVGFRGLGALHPELHIDDVTHLAPDFFFVSYFLGGSFFFFCWSALYCFFKLFSGFLPKVVGCLF